MAFVTVNFQCSAVLATLFLILGNNDFLRVLDLSWNHLRMRGAMAIGSALQVKTKTKNTFSSSTITFYLR